MWRTALMSTPFLWGWERCYKMDVRLVKWQIVSFEGQVDHRWLSDQQQEVLFPGVRAAWGQQHPGQGAGPPPVRPGLQPHQVDGSKLLQDFSLPIRWWADGLCGQVIWVKNKEYSWQQMWLFFRNGIVIIDECPGVALDHFEEKDILIFKLYKMGSMTFCALFLNSHHNYQVLDQSYLLLSGSFVGPPPQGDDWVGQQGQEPP